MKPPRIVRLTRQNCSFLCCDIQAAFQNTVGFFDQVSRTASLLVRAAECLKIPVIVSEQYPEKLGRTVDDIDLRNCFRFSKTQFSMLTDEFPASILTERQVYVLFGIETHVCIQQTAFDLLEATKDVVIVTDATSSSRELDRSTSLHTLSQAGAILMSAESVLFEILRGKDCHEFRQISGIAKELASTNLRSHLSSL